MEKGILIILITFMFILSNVSVFALGEWGQFQKDEELTGYQSLIGDFVDNVTSVGFGNGYDNDIQLFQPIVEELDTTGQKFLIMCSVGTGDLKIWDKKRTSVKPNRFKYRRGTRRGRQLQRISRI